LEAYYASVPRPNFTPESTANWRKYVASWEIKNNRLYLTAITANLCDDPVPTSMRCEKHHPASLRDLFKVKDGKVFAEWYTGTLRVPVGAMLRYVHMGYESIYEFDLLIVVEKGVVKSTTTRDNRGQVKP
jgi:hypothetical protein